MATSISDIPFGSTVKTIRGLTSFLDTGRQGELHPFESHRVLDAYYDRGEFNDHEGWYTVCLETSEGERFWVQAPDQPVTVEPGGLDLGIDTLPPVPGVEFVYAGSLRPGDRIEHDGVEGTIVDTVRYEDIDDDGDPVPYVGLTVETRRWGGARWRFSPDEQVRVEDKELHVAKRVYSLRQVPVGASVGLQRAYEPVRGGDFDAPRHMREGTIRAMKPADPDYQNMLVYLVSAEGEGWLKVPTRQGVRIIETAPGPVPPAPWDASAIAVAAAGPEAATLAGTVPGTVVSGLTVYPLDAVTGLTQDQARVLDNALIQDIRPLGVDVDGRAMMLLSIHDQYQESVVIAEAASTLTRDFEVPARAKPASVQLEPITHDELLRRGPNAPILAQGLNEHGQPAAFYGNLMDIQQQDTGLTLLPENGRITPGSQWLTAVQEGSLWQFRDTASEQLPVVPAVYLQPGQTIVNDDGARAMVIANQAEQAGVRNIVVQLEGVGVNGGIQVPSGKLFAVENNMATLTPEAIEYEMSLAHDIHQMPDHYEETFAKVVGIEDPHAPGLG